MNTGSIKAASSRLKLAQSTISSHIHKIRVLLAEPYIMYICMYGTTCEAGPPEGFSAILTDKRKESHFIDPAGVNRIGEHPGKIKWPVSRPGFLIVYFSDSTRVKTRLGSAGLTRTAILPLSPSGMSRVSSVQVSPPSVDLYRPLPGPPELKVHALRLNCHIPA